MAKFNLQYGLKGQPLIKSTSAFLHLGEAMEKAQMRALHIFEATKQGEDLHQDIKDRQYGDPITAYGNFLQEADEYIEFFAEEIFPGKSQIYFVTNNQEMFEEEGFMYTSIDAALEMLAPLKEIGLDTETTGLSCFDNDLLLLQLGIFEFQVVFDITSFDGRIPKKVREFLEEDRLYLLQNAKFDLKFLFRQDVLLKNVYDTFLVETIITNGLQFGGRGLAAIAEKYCNVTLDKSVREDFLNMRITRRGIIYGANDVKYLPEIKKKQLEEVKKFKLERAVNLDNVFVIVLAYTEYCGIKLDFDKWMIKTRKKQEDLLKYREELTDHLHKDGKMKYFSGMTDLFSGEMECIINWNSPKQVVKLFEEYGINVEVHEKGKTRKTVNADVLKPQREEFPILKSYIKYKEMQKEVSTYGESWKTQINKVTGRIHTTFKQLNDTGRLSSGNKRDGTVNLQNIPADKETRACFVAEPGNVLVDADYSSQEQILMANFSLEPKLLDFYAKGFTDMHSYIAFLIYHDIRRCSLEELTPEKLAYLKDEYPEERSKAKGAGFAINYGGNGSTIARSQNISKKEGDFVYNSYFESFPDLKKYFDEGFAKAAHFGYIEFNPVTRRKYFFDKTKEAYFYLHERVSDKYFWVNDVTPKETFKMYNQSKSGIQRLSQNYPSQGSAADITKFAAILFMREILERGWWMKVLIVNQVHDELLVECPKEVGTEVSEILIDCMKKAAVPFCKTLPLDADALIGDHWLH